MSYLFILSEREASVLSSDYHPSIYLDEGATYELGLIDFDVNNSIPNVDERNNKFHYDEDNVIEIPVGSYELDDINKYIKNYLINNTKEKEKTVIEIKANNNTLKCEIKCNKTIDFTPSDSIGQLLGFTKRKLNKNEMHFSDFPVDIMRVNIVRIECNLVSNSYTNGESVHTIHAFYPTTPPGYKIVEKPSNVIYLPINTHIINNITLKIVDQNGELVNFRKEVVTVTLHLRKRVD